MENWRKVGKNSFYEVSDCGRVRNTITGLVLKTGIDRYGYKKIHLRKVDDKKVSLAIGAGKKDNRTGLLRGYGIRSSLDNFPWFPYREEVIITNRENRIALPVYRVEIDGVSKDVIGLLALYNLLNTGSDKPLSQLTEASIVRSSNIPNLSVVRLVKPIETKTKI